MPIFANSLDVALVPGAEEPVEMMTGAVVLAAPDTVGVALELGLATTTPSVVAAGALRSLRAARGNSPTSIFIAERLVGDDPEKVTRAFSLPQVMPVVEKSARSRVSLNGIL